MGEPRAVVITGASRGLGFASAVSNVEIAWAIMTPFVLLAAPLINKAVDALTRASD